MKKALPFLLLIGCSLMIILSLISSDFFKSKMYSQLDDSFPLWNDEDERNAPATFSEAHAFDLNRTLHGPSLDYEGKRRNIERAMEVIWSYLRSQFQELQNSVEDKNMKAKIDQILDLGGEQYRTIIAGIYNLSQLDGYSPWRRDELEKLSHLVQQRLFYLQNPPNCRSAKKIVCNFRVECGFGCQVHHLSFCMIMAYGTGRTLILQSKGWSYAKEGWERFFLPLSETCLDDSGKTKAKWSDPSSNEKIQVLELPIVGYLPHKPDFLPLAVPEDLSQRLIRAHGNPAVWWIGQIMKFIMRLQPDVEDYIKNKTTALGFTHPIVGIHVRRTDKLKWEAKFHGIEEYMAQAEEFYQRLERRQDVPVRRIYLATDEPKLLTEARNKYTKYVFVSDNAITNSAGLSTRFRSDSLKGFLADLFLLARSDFLVCTFSSNVGRLAYEIMQSRHEDVAAKAFSLDRSYFWHGQNLHVLTTLYEHKASNDNEIELRPGDSVIGNDEEESRNVKTGYSKGTNQRLQRAGLYPTYKVGDKTKIVKMPTYPGAMNFHL